MKHGTDTIPEEVVKDPLKETKFYTILLASEIIGSIFSDDKLALSRLIYWQCSGLEFGRCSVQILIRTADILTDASLDFLSFSRHIEELGNNRIFPNPFELIVQPI